MANIKSQKKRNRQNEKARLRNKTIMSDLKTSIKKVEAAAAAKLPLIDRLQRATASPAAADDHRNRHQRDSADCSAMTQGAFSLSSTARAAYGIRCWQLSPRSASREP